MEQTSNQGNNILQLQGEFENKYMQYQKIILYPENQEYVKNYCKKWQHQQVKLKQIFETLNLNYKYHYRKAINQCLHMCIRQHLPKQEVWYDKIKSLLKKTQAQKDEQKLNQLKFKQQCRKSFERSNIYLDLRTVEDVINYYMKWKNNQDELNLRFSQMYPVYQQIYQQIIKNCLDICIQKKLKNQKAWYKKIYQKTQVQIYQKSYIWKKKIEREVCLKNLKKSGIYLKIREQSDIYDYYVEWRRNQEKLLRIYRSLQPISRQIHQQKMKFCIRVCQNIIQFKNEKNWYKKMEKLFEENEPGKFSFTNLIKKLSIFFGCINPQLSPQNKQQSQLLVTKLDN